MEFRRWRSVSVYLRNWLTQIFYLLIMIYWFNQYCWLAFDVCVLFAICLSTQRYSTSMLAMCVVRLENTVRIVFAERRVTRDRTFIACWIGWMPHFAKSFGTFTMMMESQFANMSVKYLWCANDKWNMLKLNFPAKVYCGISGVTVRRKSSHHQAKCQKCSVVFAACTVCSLCAMCSCWGQNRWWCIETMRIHRCNMHKAMKLANWTRSARRPRNNFPHALKIGKAAPPNRNCRNSWHVLHPVYYKYSIFRVRQTQTAKHPDRKLYAKWRTHCSFWWDDHKHTPARRQPLTFGQIHLHRVTKRRRTPTA